MTSSKMMLFLSYSKNFVTDCKRISSKLRYKFSVSSSPLKKNTVFKKSLTQTAYHSFQMASDVTDEICILCKAPFTRPTIIHHNGYIYI